MQKFLTALAAVAVVTSSTAYAVLPPEVSTLTSDLQSDGAAFITLVIGVIAILAGGIFAIRLMPGLVKKVAGWLK